MTINFKIVRFPIAQVGQGALANGRLASQSLLAKLEAGTGDLTRQVLGSGGNDS